MVVLVVLVELNLIFGVDCDNFGSLFKCVFNMFDCVKDIGLWDQQYGDVMVVVENVFMMNNWDSELDQFLIDLICEVGSILFWKLEEWVNYLVDLFGDCYDFDEWQLIFVCNMIICELNKMFFWYVLIVLVYLFEIVEM